MNARRLITTLAALATIAAPVLGRAAQPPTDVAGVPAGQIGLHGPTSNFLSGDLELLGHEPILASDRTTADPTDTAPIGNNGGVALVDDCAYVGRWHEYSGQNPITIVNVSDPTAPRAVGSVPGSALLGAVSREIRAIDLPNYELLVVLTFSKYLDEGAVTPGLNSLHFYGFTDGDCTKPVHLGQYDGLSFRGHEFYLWVDPNPAHEVDGHPRTLVYVTTPISGSDMIVIDASRPAEPQLIGVYNAGQPIASPSEANLTRQVPAGLGKYTHSLSMSPDGRTAYISHWDGGFFSIDTSDFADGVSTPVLKPKGLMTAPLLYEVGHPGNTHSAVVADGTRTAVIGDEIYVSTDGCPYGWLRTASLGDEQTPPSQLGEFRLAENRASNCAGFLSASRNSAGFSLDGTFTMHNQTVTNRYVLTSWYGGGLRVIDVADARNPVEVAAFVPKPVEHIGWQPDTTAPVYGRTAITDDDWWVSTWSYPVIRDGLIYVTDVRSGLYVLRAKAGSPLAENLARYAFLEGNSNLGDLL